LVAWWFYTPTHTKPRRSPWLSLSSSKIGALIDYIASSYSTSLSV
jgi:hypothetical protein